METIKKAFALLLSFSLPAFSINTSTSTVVESSSGTARSTKRSSMHMKDVVPKSLRQVPHEIQKQIKKTKPNPKVGRTTPAAMPVPAPDMPKGPQPDTEPLPAGANKFFDVVAKIMTTSWGSNIFVWLPAVSTDPNTGPTMGLLPVLVLADPQNQHIRHLFAPSATYNDLFGFTGTWRYYWYPTDDSQFFTYASYSKRTNRDFKIRYENPSLFDKVLYVRGELYHSVDASHRFFGLGPNSRESDEAGYTFRETGGKTSVGINFFGHMRATVGGRFVTEQTRDNIIEDLPDLKAKFPAVNGTQLQQTVAHEFRLLWDSRDLPVTPSKGTSAEFAVEKTNRGWGSNADFFRHTLDAKQFFPWKNPKNVTVVHGFYERVMGSAVPFYEAAQLGGRETLRGFGDGRFVDMGKLGLSAEHRYRLAQLKLMGIETNFEMAPFVDLGTVFPHLNAIQRKDFLLVGGVGFRAAVKPNVVGDVELGFGKEGPAVFVDINYPF